MIPNMYVDSFGRILMNSGKLTRAGPWTKFDLLSHIWTQFDLLLHFWTPFDLLSNL